MAIALYSATEVFDYGWTEGLWRGRQRDVERYHISLNKELRIELNDLEWINIITPQRRVAETDEFPDGTMKVMEESLLDCDDQARFGSCSGLLLERAIEIILGPIELA